jgi:signal transduction histidine kinase
MTREERSKLLPFMGSLYWRISLVFFILLSAVGVAYIYVTLHYSGMYAEEVNQRINRNTAHNIVENSTPFYNGEVIEPALEEMFHHVRAINPLLEVYLIDPEGRVIAWYPPEKQLVRDSIDLVPVISFIEADGEVCIKGPDPLHASSEKVFSASPLTMNGMLYAYIYVVLTSEQYATASDSLFGNFLLQISARTMAIALFTTLIVGLLIIRVITRNYSKILEVMQKFRKGDLKARVHVSSSGDEKQLAEMFNEMADILTENIEKVEQVEKLRRELIANVSHDLRTPIAIIKGYIETLQMKAETVSPEEREQYINMVSQSAAKLERLVSELFELSKLEANQVQAKKEPFIISELVSDIAGKYKLIAEKQKISLRTDLSRNLPPVYADVSLIERVMQNLIDNAIKYTPEGGEVTISTHNGSSEAVSVDVSDTGIGIPENEHDQIFSRYHKSHNIEGLSSSTGLGLAIAKKILDLHDSTLKVHSKENQGSRFTFSLGYHQN